MLTLPNNIYLLYNANGESKNNLRLYVVQFPLKLNVSVGGGKLTEFRNMQNRK